MSHSSILNWPEQFERTDPHKRDTGNQFSANFRQTQREFRREIDRLGAQEWHIDHITGSGGDPGVVVRWRKDGVDHAVACDAYSSKRANLRACYLWFRETRKAGDRPVKTGQDQMAAAALPGETHDGTVVGSKPDHEILGVGRNADPEVVKRTARGLMAKYHPDSGSDPDEEMFKQVTRAKTRMLGEE